MGKKAQHRDSLDHVLVSAWAMLTHGATHSSDPFNRPVLATGRFDGCQVRTVILRHADNAQRTLTCFADARSAKITEIEQCGCVQWLFYHPRKKIQLRIHGPAVVHTGGPVADAQWSGVKGLSRLNFCTEAAPGTTVDGPSSGLSTRLLKDLTKLVNSNAGREHFAAIVGRVEMMDWLQLRKSGNRRARFEWTADRFEATWIVP